MWTCTILNTGYFRFDGGAMFGTIPKRYWERRYPADDQNGCRVAMNCVLLRRDKQLVVVDTGVGHKALGALSYYRFSEVKELRNEVQALGFSPEQVTDVILTHLHFDHCGGTTYPTADGRLAMSFPHARHHVGCRQWEAFLQPNDLEKDSFRREDLQAVDDAGLLCLHDRPIELYPGLDLQLFDGHTAGQLVVTCRTDKHPLIIPGDIIPTQAHLSDAWISAYDLNPLATLDAKRQLKQQAEMINARWIFYHDAQQTPEESPR